MVQMISRKRRFGWLLGTAGVGGIALTVAMLAYIKEPGAPLPIHVILAVTLAVMLSSLLAAGLMGLIFLSSDSGHDQMAADEAARHDPDGWQSVDDEPR